MIIDKPEFLSISLHSQCQLRCPYCLHVNNKKKSILRPLKFKKILENIVRYVKLREIAYSPFGEPFFPNTYILESMLIGFQYCDQTVIVTNGIGINNLIARFLAKHQEKIAMVYISVHDNLDSCTRKVDNLVKNGFPNDKIMLKIMNPPFPKDYRYMDCTQLHHWALDKEQSFVRGCAHPSMSFVKGKFAVDDEGDIHACCLAWGKNLILGNLLKQSLEEIWEQQLKTFASYYSSPQKQPKDFLCRTCKYALRAEAPS